MTSEKLNIKFIDNWDFAISQQKYYNKLKNEFIIFKIGIETDIIWLTDCLIMNKIINKSESIYENDNNFAYYTDWYFRRFTVWFLNNKLHIKNITWDQTPKNWSIIQIILYKHYKIIKPTFSAIDYYVNYKIIELDYIIYNCGELCEFCNTNNGDILLSCIFCAKFGCKKCVECYIDKDFGYCRSCNIKK